MSGTEASSVKIMRLLPNILLNQRELFGRQIGLNSAAEETLINTVKVDFDDISELASALTAPCSRRGLECRLERGADGDAIVMRSLPCVDAVAETC